MYFFKKIDPSFKSDKMCIAKPVTIDLNCKKNCFSFKMRKYLTCY